MAYGYCHLIFDTDRRYNAMRARLAISWFFRTGRHLLHLRPISQGRHRIISISLITVAIVRASVLAIWNAVTITVTATVMLPIASMHTGIAMWIVINDTARQ